MSALAVALKDLKFHQSVKPLVIAAFSEVAMAIEADFAPYVQYSFALLSQAWTTQAPPDDDYLVEYINRL